MNSWLWDVVAPRALLFTLPQHVCAADPQYFASLITKGVAFFVPNLLTFGGSPGAPYGVLRGRLWSLLIETNDSGCTMPIYACDENCLSPA